MHMRLLILFLGMAASDPLAREAYSGPPALDRALVSYFDRDLPDSHDGAPFLPLCGNGVLDHGEECDDGNRRDGDGCSADCSDNDSLVDPLPVAWSDASIRVRLFCVDGGTVHVATEDSYGVLQSTERGAWMDRRGFAKLDAMMVRQEVQYFLSEGKATKDGRLLCEVPAGPYAQYRWAGPVLVLVHGAAIALVDYEREQCKTLDAGATPVFYSASYTSQTGLRAAALQRGKMHTLHWPADAEPDYGPTIFTLELKPPLFTAAMLQLNALTDSYPLSDGEVANVAPGTLGIKKSNARLALLNQAQGGDLLQAAGPLQKAVLWAETRQLCFQGQHCALDLCADSGCKQTFLAELRESVLARGLDDGMRAFAELLTNRTHRVEHFQQNEDTKAFYYLANGTLFYWGRRGASIRVVRDGAVAGCIPYEIKVCPAGSYGTLDRACTPCAMSRPHDEDTLAYKLKCKTTRKHIHVNMAASPPHQAELRDIRAAFPELTIDFKEHVANLTAKVDNPLHVLQAMNTLLSTRDWTVVSSPTAIYEEHVNATYPMHVEVRMNRSFDQLCNNVRAYLDMFCKDMRDHNPGALFQCDVLYLLREDGTEVPCANNECACRPQSRRLLVAGGLARGSTRGGKAAAGAAKGADVRSTAAFAATHNAPQAPITVVSDPKAVDYTYRQQDGPPPLPDWAIALIVVWAVATLKVVLWAACAREHFISTFGGRKYKYNKLS